MSVVVGFLTGVLASMGLGGGFILVVWLTLFMDVEQKSAQGINLLFFLPIALLSLCIHIKNGLVNKALVKKLVFGGVVGAVLGTLGTRLLDNSGLRMMFAVFLLAFGLRELFSPTKKGKDEKRAPDKH
ncbi:MAG: sulfite exporter TauE/SafE family protein [Oscillospiraceae bacterium]